MNPSENTPTPILDEVPQSSTDQSDPKLITSRYTVIDRLGQGGMGRVYTAHDSRLNKTVAIKILFGTVFAQSYWARFQQEAKAASKLKHPAIVQVLDFGSFDHDKPFLVMEYVEGQTLSDLVKSEGAIEPARALTIISQLCRGMQHAHGRKVLHRDLKPSNILIADTDNGETANILDFGIAKVVEQGDYKETLTKTGQIVGSPRYMSPEQAGGETVDGRTDIYSLGCVLYFMLTGAPPYTGQNPLEVIGKHIQDPIPKLNDNLSSPLPDEFQNLIERSMAKSRSDRYASMEAFAESVDSLSHSLVGYSEQKNIEEGLSLSGSSEISERKDETKRGRQAALLIGGFALTLAICGLVAGALLFNKKEGGGAEKSAPPKAKPVEPSTKTARLSESLKAGSMVVNDAKLSVAHYDKILQVSGDDSTAKLEEILATPGGEREILWVTKTTLDEKMIEVLSRFKKLRKLRLINSETSAEALRALGQLKSLTDLHFYRSPVSLKELQALSKVKSIEVINFEEIEVYKPELEIVSKMKNLKTLRLLRIPNIKPNDLDCFNRKPNFELVMSKCPGIPEDIFKYLRLKYGISIKEDYKSANLGFAEAFSE